MIKNVAIIGAGRMGSQIAMNTAIHGCEVFVSDPYPAALENAKKWSVEYLAGRVAKGRLTQEQTDEIQARFRVVDSLEEAVKDADLIIEAVTELEEVKREVLHNVGELAREDAIIGSNSSFMPSSMFAPYVKNPARLANLHFFNPALVLKLVEIVKGEHTAQSTIDALLEYANKTGKTPIVVQREIDGFVANRLLNACKNEALYLVENGYCTYQEIDIACKNGLGHPLGQFELMDMTGVDTTYYRMKRDIEKTGKEPVGYALIKKMFDENRLGKKTGRGFYDYE